MILFEDAKATAPPDPPSPFISPVERVKEFKLLFPNYEGELMVDGGVTDIMLEELKELGVDISVQGGAIFG